MPISRGYRASRDHKSTNKNCVVIDQARANTLQCQALRVKSSNLPLQLALHRSGGWREASVPGQHWDSEATYMLFSTRTALS
jgi:hypothetical protein